MIKKLVYILILVFTSAILTAQEKPNIVLFFIDDWAWNGSSIQMDDEISNSYIPSMLVMPNLEKLATEGMTFSNAYSSAPQCSPSRVALQTGQSSPRNGFTVYMNNGGSDYYDNSKEYEEFPVVPCVSDMTIDPNATTIPEALAPHGYVSAHLGKWHMRGHPDDEGYVLNDGDTDNKAGNQEIPDDPKLMFSITGKAIGFIEEQTNAQKPFYLQLSHYGMHEGRECLAATRTKYQAMPEMQAYYKSKGTTAGEISYKSDPATWLGMGEDLDGRIGAVLDKLKELGIEDNTYVIVTSDNGYRHDFYDEVFRLPQPLHGHKWWLWQAGLRVAMVAKGPDIPAGSVCDENVVNYDFLPTFIDWAGGNPETELSDIDGVSLAPLMRGVAAEPDFSERTLYFHYPHYRETMPMSVAVAGDKKVVHFYERPDLPMYFDIASDIGEVTNIAETDPAGHQALFDDMIQYLTNVGARIPLFPNPDYDSLAYVSHDKSDKRRLWGPFAGVRDLDNDEVISTKAKLYQHLSSINKSNILTDGSSVVTAWKDQSFKENNAVPGLGSVIFPSQKLFESGLAGVDFGSTNTTLELLSSHDSDALIDFSGAASSKDGFAVAMVFNPNLIKDEWCYLVGNTSTVEDANSFGIRYNGSGSIEAYLGGEIVQGSKTISANQTAVVVVNYNSISEKFDMLTSAGDTLSKQIPIGDFSNESALFLGGISTESNGFFDGLVGEVKLFDMALKDEQVYSEASELLKNWTNPAEEKLIQHLDATVEGSVVVNGSGLLSTWKDLSGSENHAIPLGSALYYPAASKSETGLSGVDFGSDANRLVLFSDEGSDAILDFTGVAARNSGVSILLSFKIDDFVQNQNDILGNSSAVDDVNGFGMRYDENGQPRIFVGGQKIIQTKALQKNETVIFAVNYNKSEQKLKFWNSALGQTVSTNLAPDDFSNNNPFTLGACNGSSRFLIGMVGEVKVYNYSLSDSIFDQQCKLLSDKWINGFSEVSWVRDPFSKTNATVNTAYTESITNEDIYYPQNTVLRFSKISGPGWLNVSESGELTGTPTDGYIGENSFLVQAEWNENATVQATLLIEVGNLTSVDSKIHSVATTFFPNPVKDKINIEGVEKGYYTIHNILGNRLLGGDLISPIHVGGLKGGMYILTVNGQSFRFVKGNSLHD